VVNIIITISFKGNIIITNAFFILTKQKKHLYPIHVKYHPDWEEMRNFQPLSHIKYLKLDKILSATTSLHTDTQVGIYQGSLSTAVTFCQHLEDYVASESAVELDDAETDICIAYGHNTIQILHSPSADTTNNMITQG